MQQLLESNQEISRRLRNLEGTYDSESVLTTCFRNGNSDKATEKDGEHADFSHNYPFGPEIHEFSSDQRRSRYCYTFERDLETSRVYKRTRNYESDVSFASSAIRTHSWSVFSGLSLSQVSKISAIGLPVYRDDIFNDESYKFESSKQPEPSGANAIPAESSSNFHKIGPNKLNRGTRNSGLVSIKASAPSLKRPQPQFLSSKYPRRYNLVIVGDGGVGKTSLCIRVCPLAFKSLCL